MTDPSEECDETRGGAEMDDEALDELAESTTGLRTTQERESASGDTSVGRDNIVDDGTSGAGELDELVDPASNLRTAQEREVGEALGDIDAGDDERVGGRDE